MTKGKDGIELVWVQDQVRAEAYEFSEHAERERQADRIPISDVEHALLNAEIKSCLIVGYGATRYPIHIVCGRSPKGTLRLITVYIPSLHKWVDAKTRTRG
jgi:hypothetical protein